MTEETLIVNDQIKYLQGIMNSLMGDIKKPDEFLDDPLFEVEKANYLAIKEFVGLAVVAGQEFHREPENLWSLLEQLTDQETRENPKVKETLTQKLVGRPSEVFRSLGIGREGNAIAKLDQSLRTNLTSEQNGMLINVLERI